MNLRLYLFRSICVSASRWKLYLLNYVTITLMKTLRVTLLTVLGLTAGALFAADQTSKADRVEVTFVNPDKFTDAADAQRGSDWGRDANLDVPKKYIIERASRYVPEGQKLSVSITDVDLAGEIEPWRSSSLRDARIMKDIYFPRIDLSYKLTDATGAVVKEGSRHLSDMNYLMNIHTDRSDPRVYDKSLLDDWIRRDLATKKK